MRRGALILCGGRSTRMGRDKAWLPLPGHEAMLQRVVRLVAPAVAEIVVVARPGQDLPPLPEGVLVVRDEVPDRGPLAGLGRGLAATSAQALYVTACDVPFLRREVVDLLFERLGGHDVVVVEEEGLLHPLAAVYRRTVEPIVRRLLEEGRRRPVSLYELVPTVRVDAEELRGVDPELDTLRNLNTREAWASAVERLDTEGEP